MVIILLTNYFLQCVSEDIFKHQEMSTIPYDFYIALSSTSPSADGTGVTEPSSDTGYKRAYVDNSILIFGESDDNATVTNHTKIFFSESVKPWNSITHYAIFDAPEEGNLLMYGALNETMNVPIKTIISIPSNTLSIATSNGTTG